MIKVSVEEARERGEELMLCIERGEKVGIVRDEAVVAVLAPTPVEPAKPGVREAVEEMKRFRDEHGPLFRPGENVRDLLEAGRRF
jgi:hypothetical protein